MQLCKWILTFTNEENIDQPIIKQFSEIAQRCISWPFNWEAYIDRGQHKVTNSDENDQGQQLRGRRRVRMHGSAQRQNRGRGRRGQGQRHISDEIMLSIMALQWLKGAAKNWEIDHILNNSNIWNSLFQSISHIQQCVNLYFLEEIWHS